MSPFYGDYRFVEEYVRIEIKMKNIAIKGIKGLGIVILHLLILGLIPLNMYMMNINEILAIVLTVCWIVLVRVIVKLISKKKDSESENTKALKNVTGKVLLIILDVLIIFLMILATEFNSYWNSCMYRDIDWSNDTGNQVLTREDALSDYNYAMKYLKKIHPLTLGGLPDDMEARAKEVKAGLESRDSITGYELARELESIFALAGDGHTHVDENYSDAHYMKYIYEHRKAGDVLVGINGVSFEDFLVDSPGYVSYDEGMNAYGVRMLKNRISTLEGLRYLGYDIEGEIVYNYVSEAGEEIDVTVTKDDFLGIDEYYEYAESVTGDDMSGDREDKDYVRYEIDEKNSIAVFTLDSCDYNSHYKEVVKAMFDEIHEKDIKNIVVDLRNNGCGSSLCANEFIRYLDVEEYKSWADEVRYGCLLFKHSGGMIKNNKKGYGFSGKVFVMTSIYSYSAAMDFAMLIQDNGLGSIVGEPCGNMPASYGQVTQYILPRSGIYIQISIKRWHRVDESKEDLPILPDTECNPDDALDVIYDILAE